MTIIEILESYDVPFRRTGHRHVTKGWIGINCPTCDVGTSDGFHLGINLAGRYASCWRCGRADLRLTLEALTGMSLGSLLSEGLDLDDISPAKPKRAGQLRIPTGLGPLQECHRYYLRKRGFVPEELERVWGIQGFGLQHRFPWRIWIPIHYKGQLVSWTTRKPSDSGYGAKYVSAKADEESVRAKSILFGIDHVRHACVVVEGPLDVMRIGPGAVGTFGVGWTTAQLNLLKAIPQVAVCFDSEPLAQRRARRLAEALSPKRVKVVELEAKDPGAATAEEVAEVRRRYLD